MRAFPGYTVQSLLNEPPEVFEGLWTLEMTKRQMEDAAARSKG